MGPPIIVLSMPPLVKHGLHVWAECRQQHNSASITRTLVGLGKWSLITHSTATELLSLIARGGHIYNFHQRRLKIKLNLRSIL